jgi:GDP-D-mannose 3', 5'-epimerase
MRDLQRQERDRVQAAKQALAYRREAITSRSSPAAAADFVIIEAKSAIFFISKSNRESCNEEGLLKRALVCGAGGFIGGHLVNKLKRAGYWVRGVDIKAHEFCPSAADEFLLLDLRRQQGCEAALTVSGGTLDEVYQLAADMGGMGFIHSAECEIMHNSALINIYMTSTAAKMGIPRYFFSSSVCVYRDMELGEPEMSEEDAVPANPDNEYGWEKLYSERVAMAYERRFAMEVRIARFQNCYGAEGTWRGGREKAPAAICRKVAESDDGGTIEVWGDGSAVRSYTHVSDMVEGIFMLMQSDLHGPVNIGCPQYVSVDELAATVAEVAGKKIHIKHVDGPVGVHSRNFSNAKIYSIGWRATVLLKEGIELTYPWIDAQVKALANRSSMVVT